MGWNDAPPSKEELAQAQISTAGSGWADQPPSGDELAAVGAKKDHMFGPGGQVPDWMSRHPNVQQLTRGFLGTAPGVGAAVGGGLAGTAGAVEGLATGGVASPALAIGQGLMWAAAGGAGGKAVENMGKHYLLGEAKTPQEQLVEPTIAAKDAAQAQGYGQIAGTLVQNAAQSPITQKASGAVKSGLGKVGEWFTGVPKKTIQTYAENADEIAQMSKESAGSVSEAADKMRKDFQQSIQQTRQELNGQISGALKNTDARVDGEKIVGAIESAKSKIDPDLYPEQVKAVDDLIGKVRSKIASDGTIHASDAHTVKQFLQDKASSAYRNPGDIFSVGTEGAKAAKSGAAVARQLVSDAVPEVSEANGALSQLHEIEDNMNSNLIAPGKPEAGLISAGTGGNARNAQNLEKLGEITGTDMRGKAEKLAAMKTFSSPGWSPNTTTGAKVYHAGVGGLLGGGLGYAEGGKKGAVTGAIAGSMLSSPAALKQAINAGLVVGNMAEGYALTPVGQQFLGRGLISPFNDDEAPAQPGAPPEAQGLISTPAQYKEDNKKKSK